MQRSALHAHALCSRACSPAASACGQLTPTAAPHPPVSAKYPPPKPSEAEAAVQAVKSEAALDIIGKLLYNAAVAPKEEKFRCAQEGRGLLQLGLPAAAGDKAA